MWYLTSCFLADRAGFFYLFFYAGDRDLFSHTAKAAPQGQDF
jgi:hypothetical protein